MAKTEKEQEKVTGTEDLVKVRVLKSGIEIDGWRFATGAVVTVTVAQAEALESSKAAKRIY